MIEFPSGAKRAEVKPRYDLIEPCATRRLAARCGVGAERYGDYNWQKGLPPEDVYNHIIDHLTLYREKMRNGETDGDDDLAGAMWGVMVLMWQQEHPKTVSVEDITAAEAKKYHAGLAPNVSSGPVPHVHAWTYCGISRSRQVMIYSCECGMLEDHHANGETREYKRLVLQEQTTANEVGGGSYDDKRLKAPLKPCTCCGKDYYFVQGHDICRDCFLKQAHP